MDLLRVTPLHKCGISGTEPSCSVSRDNSSGGGDDDDTSEHSSTINWYRKAPLGAQRSSPFVIPEYHALAPVGYMTWCAFLYMLGKRDKSQCSSLRLNPAGQSQSLL
jgi:hypothetical protein